MHCTYRRSQNGTSSRRPLKKPQGKHFDARWYVGIRLQEERAEKLVGVRIAHEVKVGGCFRGAIHYNFFVPARHSLG